MKPELPTATLSRTIGRCPVCHASLDMNITVESEVDQPTWPRDSLRPSAGVHVRLLAASFAHECDMRTNGVGFNLDNLFPPEAGA